MSLAPLEQPKAVPPEPKPAGPKPPQTAAQVPALVGPTKRPLWPWGLAVVGVLVLGGLFYWQPWATAVPEVAVEVMALGPVSRVLAVNGRVAGVVSVDLRPSVSGILTEVAVAEGAKVAVGDVLARVDGAAQQAVVRQALAGLDAALVAQAEAQATFTRTKALGVNVPRATLDSAARALTTAGQEVARQVAVEDQAQIQMAKYTIRAPVAGAVLALTAKPGQSVDLTSVLMTLTDLGALVIETDVDESYATQVAVGQGASLQLSGESAVRPGHVSFVAQQVDTATGGLAVKITPDAALVAPIGLTVTTNITVDDRPAALTIPRAALLAGGDAVLVINGSTAQSRAVTVILWPASRLIVTEGLAVGDRVITAPTGLTEGQTVTGTP